MGGNQQQAGLVRHCRLLVPLCRHIRYDLGSRLVDLPVGDLPQQGPRQGRLACNRL